MTAPRLKATLAAVLASIASISPSTADLLIYEPFDYPSTGNTNGDGVHLGDGGQGGALGLTGTWATQINNVEMEVRDEAMAFTDSGGIDLPVSGLSIRRSSRSGYATNSIAVDPAATAALTSDNSTMWMSFLYEDEGFSGPDSSVMLASDPLALANNHSLSVAGYGVGILVGESAQAANSSVETGYYLDSTGTTRTQSTLNPNESENQTFLLAAKVNWKPDGTPDEIYIFNITDLTTEPLEADAIASDTFDMPLTAQRSLDTLNIGETQIDAFDEIRFGTSFADVVATTPATRPRLVITFLGDGDWLAELSGNAGGAYVLYAAADLQFDPGTLIDNLRQDDPGDPGTVDGTNSSILTLDGEGLGRVRMSLAGNRRDFIRAQTAPPPPPLLSEHFDAAAALPDGWVRSGPVNGTTWEVGVPSGAISGPDAAASLPNCAGTNIGGYYTENTDVTLTSPPIAIPAGSAATLTFRQLIDTDNGGDSGSVRILDADDADTPINGLEITGLQGLGSIGDGWTQQTLSLPSVDVGGRTIKVQFRFVSDAGTVQDTDVFGGFYIDDVLVETAP